MGATLAAALAVPVLIAQPSDSPTIPNLPDINPDILKLVIYDQWDRGNDLFTDHRRSPDDKVDVATGRRPYRSPVQDPHRLSTARSAPYSIGSRFILVGSTPKRPHNVAWWLA